MWLAMCSLYGPYVHGAHSMPVLNWCTFSIALFTAFFVYAPFTLLSAWTRISPSTKPIWLKLPMPPETSLPYCLRIASYRFMVGVCVGSGGVNSALTNSLLFHTEPSDEARKSVSHGVEHAQALTLAAMPSFCAAWRMISASGGVKLSTTAPVEPASWTSRSATESPLLIGTLSVSACTGRPFSFAIGGMPPSLYPAPGTLD